MVVAMIDKFVRAFVRNPDGSWFCREPVHIVGMNGPASTTPGVTYRKGKLTNGYDVAQWLEDYQEYRVRPLGVEFR